MKTSCATLGAKENAKRTMKLLCGGKEEEKDGHQNSRTARAIASSVINQAALSVVTALFIKLHRCLQFTCLIYPTAWRAQTGRSTMRATII